MDLDGLGRALDLDPEDPDRVGVMRHIRTCPDCEANANVLRDVELILGAAQPEVWGLESRGCLSAGEMLRLLAGEPGGREGHVAACQPCQVELKALRTNERETEVASVALRERLRALSPQNASTEEVVRQSGRRRAGTARFRVGSRRLSSKRTRSAAIRRSSLRSPKGQVNQPAWAWGVLAMAAALLVAVAVAISPSGKSDSTLADATTPPREAAPARPLGPRVSDIQDRDPQGPQTPSTPTEVEPTYPLPHESEPLVDERTDDLNPVEPTENDPIARVTPPDEGHSTQARQPDPKAEGSNDGSNARDEAADEPEELPPVVDDGGRLELATRHLSGGLLLERDGETTRLTRRSGKVVLQPGDVLRAKTGGFVSLEEGAYELCLDKETEIRVRSAASGPVLDLTRGRLLAEVATLRADQQFRVLTRQGEFSVLGTVFAVESTPTGSRLLVAEGTVNAKGGSGEVKVPAGMGVALAKGSAVPSPTRIRSEELAWTQAWAPKRAVLYGVSFDDNKAGGFKGVLQQATGKPSGKALVIPTLKDNRFWGLCAQVGQHRMSSFRAKSDAFLAVSLRCDAPQQILLQCFNDSQKKEFKRGFTHPGGGVWKTFTVRLMDLNTYYDPGKNPVRENDLFVDLEIYVAQPGATDTVLLDDVSIYRKVYR